MKIEAIELYHLGMAIPQGSYTMSRGRSYTEFESTVVSIATETGIVGWGEVSTLGANYLPAFGKGAVAAIEVLAPHLLGQNPLHLDKMNHLMDQVMHGHSYAKSALDMACWDIFGKAVNLPVCDLLGGRFDGGMDLLTGITTGSVAEMVGSVRAYRKNGYRCFSAKLGGDPGQDVKRLRSIVETAEPGDEFYADCNGGWTRDQALRVMRQLDDLDIYFEQPCPSYRDCLSVRRRTGHPMILDEVIDGPETMLRIIEDDAADLVNIKISRLGGLTKARRVRDLCVIAGLAMTIQDTGGSGITQAAIFHLAQSTPPELRRTVYDPLVYTSDPLTDAPVIAMRGKVEASDRPGLGQVVVPDRLGRPVASFRR